MKIIETPLEGVRIIEPGRFEDERGWFMEVWNEERYGEAGLDVEFVQTNVSHSRRGVLRGMHYQHPDEQGKLVSAIAGGVFDVVVDIRRGSVSFGAWYGTELSEENRRQMWVPEGFAHGFLTLSPEATVLYNCTAVYNAASDRSLFWNDSEIGIKWPRQPAILSEKDRAAPRLRDIPREALPALPSASAVRRAPE